MRQLAPVLAFAVMTLMATPTLAANKEKDTCPTPPKAATSPSFDLIKSLQGTWKGTWVENGKKEPMQVKYKVTSGGTAVEETIFPNTPKEMVSLYTLKEGKVAMTHYCMIGNQPNMIEIKSDKNSVQLDFVKTKGINPKKDSFMSGITLTKMDDRHLIFTGTGVMQGKPMETNPIELTR